MSKNKARGTAWETACVRFGRRYWPKFDRLPLKGREDEGDLGHGPENWAFECKDEGTISLPSFLREAEQEAANKGAFWFAALVKGRRSKLQTGSVADSYFVMRLWQGYRLAREHEFMRQMLIDAGVKDIDSILEEVGRGATDLGE